MLFFTKHKHRAIMTSLAKYFRFCAITLNQKCANKNSGATLSSVDVFSNKIKNFVDLDVSSASIALFEKDSQHFLKGFCGARILPGGSLKDRGPNFQNNCVND